MIDEEEYLLKLIEGYLTSLKPNIMLLIQQMVSNYYINLMIKFIYNSLQYHMILNEYDPFKLSLILIKIKIGPIKDYVRLKD